MSNLLSVQKNKMSAKKSSFLFVIYVLTFAFPG